MSQNVDHLVLLAGRAMATGNHSGAIETLRDALTQDPEHASAHTLLAYALLGQGRIHAARFEADAALRLAPELDDCHRVSGYVAISEADLVRARRDFLAAVELDPRSTENLLGLARLLDVCDEPVEALALVEKALEIEVEPASLVLRGGMHLEAGRLAEAEEDARRALALQPEDAATLALMGQVLLRGGDREAAREFALWALQIDATDQDALSLLANIKMRESWLMGLWFRWNVWISRLGTERAVLVLLAAFVVYWVARLAIRDLGYPGAAQMLTYAWLIFALYTWVGGAIRDRIVEKEVARVRLRPNF
ncbi:MAG: tetratricopeptide repeat protein [Rhizobiales bacterium]|nr:tetratricopeptide repeat protein [Hyphomicrobiales bacterium]